MIKFTKMNPKITITPKDYDSLYNLEFNRPITNRDNLKNSIIKYGFNGNVLAIHTNLLSKDGTKKLILVDGHNRVRVAKQLNLSFEVEIVQYKFKTREEIVVYVGSLNTTQISWTTKNYVDAFCKVGISDYRLLKKYSEDTGYSLDTIGQILLHNTNTKFKTLVSTGEFKCINVNHTNTILSLANLAFLKTGRRVSGKELVVISKLFNTDIWNMDKFLHYYELNKDLIPSDRPTIITTTYTSWLSS